MNLSRWLKNRAKWALFRLFPLVLLASLADAALLFALRLLMQILGKTISVSIAEWLILTLALVCLRLVFTLWRGIAVEKSGRYLEASLSLWFLHRLQNLSPRYFHTQKSDERLMVAYDSIHIIGSSVELLMQTLQAILQLLIFLPVLFFISPWLTLVVLLIVLPVISFVQKKMHAMAPSVEEEMARRGGLRADFENAKRFFRLWSSSEDLKKMRRQLSEKVRAVKFSGISVGRKKVALSGGMETISVATVVCILAFCGWMILNGNLAAEGLILYCSALFLCYKPVKECARLLPQMRLAKSAQKTLIEFEKFPKKPAMKMHEENFLQMNQVDFSYAENARVYENLNLKILTEKPILLRGENGSGKSTLFKLIAGLEIPNAGEVILPKNFAENGIFSVSQNLILPSRKFIGEQILKRKSDEKFLAFYEKIQAEKLLKKEGLSGGECAKVALLWALASPAKILLLDEPFAFIALRERDALLNAFLQAAKSADKWTFLATHEIVADEISSQFEILDLGKLK